MPLFLFNLLSQLAEGTRQHYPVKKLLLLLWRVLQCIAGDESDIASRKAEKRSKLGLPPHDPEIDFLKSSPQDYQNHVILSSYRYPAQYIPDLSTVNPLVSDCMVNQVSMHVKREIANICDPKPKTPVHPSNMQHLHPSTDSDNPELPIAMAETLCMHQKYLYISAASVQMAREEDLMAKEEATKTSVDGQDYNRTARDKKQCFSKMSRDELLFTSLQEKLSSHIVMIVRLLYYLNLAPSDAPPPGIKPETHLTTAQIEAMPSNERLAALEWLDSVRHRELVTLSICGILMSLLKSFKCYHVLAFEHLCSILLDNNGAILILRILNSWFSNPNQHDAETDRSTASKANQGGISSPTSDGREKQIGFAWLSARRDPLQMSFMAYCRCEGSFGNFCQQTVSAGNNGLTLQSPIVNVRENSLSSSGIQASCFRAFQTTIYLLRILQKITKRKPHRINLLVQWKAPTVLKRILRINHAGLCLYALKLIKSQIPYLGKRWRQFNVPTITMIYKHLKPRLVEEYLLGDVDTKHDEANNAHQYEQHLRALIAFFLDRTAPTAIENLTPTRTSTANTATTPGATTTPATSAITSRPSGTSTRQATDDLEFALSLSARGSLDIMNPHHANLLRSDPEIAHAHEHHLDENFMMHYEEWLERE
eukprot:jgi/Hompol1/906/HPOL_005468-RA